jgi:hypothetical protein
VGSFPPRFGEQSQIVAVGSVELFLGEVSRVLQVGAPEVGSLELGIVVGDANEVVVDEEPRPQDGALEVGIP